MNRPATSLALILAVVGPSACGLAAPKQDAPAEAKPLATASAVRTTGAKAYVCFVSKTRRVFTTSTSTLA